MDIGKEILYSQETFNIFDEYILIENVRYIEHHIIDFKREWLDNNSWDISKPIVDSFEVIMEIDNNLIISQLNNQNIIIKLDKNIIVDKNMYIALRNFKVTSCEQDIFYPKNTVYGTCTEILINSY